jgi:hypothetical protein
MHPNHPMDTRFRSPAHDLGMNLAQLKQFAEARRLERDDKSSLPSSGTKDDLGKKS